jgi:hypothetical protein
MVMWHDYGAWEGVTRALEELEASRKLGLRHIRGTRLVFWRAQDSGEDRAPVPENADAPGRPAAGNFFLSRIRRAAVDIRRLAGVRPRCRTT